MNTTIAAATNPSDGNLLVKRLFTVAEILSRVRRDETSEFLVEIAAEKQDDQEIGYRESKDRLN